MISFMKLQKRQKIIDGDRLGQERYKGCVDWEGASWASGVQVMSSVFDLVADDVDVFLVRIHHDKYLRYLYFTVRMLFFNLKRLLRSSI